MTGTKRVKQKEQNQNFNFEKPPPTITRTEQIPDFCHKKMYLQTGHRAYSFITKSNTKNLFLKRLDVNVKEQH